MTNKKKIKRKKGPILCFRLTEKALDLFDAAGIDFDPPFDREYMRAMDAIEKTGTINPANYGPPPEPDEKTPPRKMYHKGTKIEISQDEAVRMLDENKRQRQ